MDREILKYLYEFFKAGDFLGYHSLNPVFEKLKIKNGNDFKYFNQRLKTILFFLKDSYLLDIDEKRKDELAMWTVRKGEGGFYSYSDFDNPIKARISESAGINYIEKIIEWEHQIALSKSVRNTNWKTLLIASISFIAIGVSAYFSSKTVTSENIKQLDTSLRYNRILLDKTLQSQIEIDSSLQIMVKLDSEKNVSSKK